jgi:hypothetical protein
MGGSFVSIAGRIRAWGSMHRIQKEVYKLSYSKQVLGQYYTFKGTSFSSGASLCGYLATYFSIMILDFL